VSPRSAADLVHARDAGHEFEFFLFYGHTPTPGVAVGQWCLSQW
jgi:hypothetical protein